MKSGNILWVALGLLLLSGPAGARQVVGWIEHVLVYPGAVRVAAKVDTGAQTSSVDCHCITPIERNGKKYVSFTVHGVSGKIEQFEKPVVRVARIKQHNGESQQRYVVRLGICLGTTYREREVTLTDRENFRYPILVGRNFLGHEFLVDPSDKYLAEPRCKGVPADE
jgi:hypothetical protein